MNAGANVRKDRKTLSLSLQCVISYSSYKVCLFHKYHGEIGVRIVRSVHSALWPPTRVGDLHGRRELGFGVYLRGMRDRCNSSGEVYRVPRDHDVLMLVLALSRRSGDTAGTVIRLFGEESKTTYA